MGQRRAVRADYAKRSTGPDAPGSRIRKALRTIKHFRQGAKITINASLLG
jgi:hypothetical protein